MIFFSDKLYDFISDMNDIQFDGTFQTVPKQFYQLWTILFSVGKHSLPAIHCLMTSKEEALYIAVLREIKKLIPQFQPISTYCQIGKIPRLLQVCLAVAFETMESIMLLINCLLNIK